MDGASADAAPRYEDELDEIEVDADAKEWRPYTARGAIESFGGGVVP